jgi:hypothetical protein
LLEKRPQVTMVQVIKPHDFLIPTSTTKQTLARSGSR